MRKSYFTGILVVIVAMVAFLLMSYTGSPIDFNDQIRPILNENCMVCHGGVRQDADLSFLFPEKALLPAKSGKYAIIPGKPGQSELIKRIKHHDQESRMPLDADALTKKEINLLERWINQGAEWSDHWSYIPVKNDISIPKCEDEWCHNYIDNFIRNRAIQEGLFPSLQADKSYLIRRVYLDLTGLPPTKEETDLFIADTSPDAYERLVERLLDSPHYGERWAAMWLDLARYADSRGYQKDLLRPDIWRYRDWVIHAFNEDLPFDQFTIFQLAGDLVPNANENQLLATAFHRNTMTNDEGGTDDEEFRVTAVLDRVNTSMEIWQGTTIGCVQCHSHPYDPIEHKEYYNLYAFFNNTLDKDDYRESPTAQLMSPDQIEKLDRWKLELENHDDTLSIQYKNRLKEYMNILPGSIPIMRELPDSMSRKTRVFERGNWLVHGAVASPDVPGFLPDFDEGFSKDRLGFANWLVDENNPLTARVTVNRIWEQIFGKGIVTTLEDFGTQGESPTHPKLLDYLSYQFVHEYKWSIKKLLKEIVLSATYKQSSEISPESLEKDPENVFLSRGPRYRLSAEQIRDQALVISGLINKKVYGKSVMPHQPEGVWNVIRHAAKWQESLGSDKHRRALYTFWRRVSPYPSMLSFDVPSRELCVSRRIRTNTPLQALITLNDPVFVEAAMTLADRMIVEAGSSLEEKLIYGFQLALMRPPDEERLELLVDFYNQITEKIENETNLDNYSKIEIEKEVMINVASVLLNLDEVIMKT